MKTALQQFAAGFMAETRRRLGLKPRKPEFDWLAFAERAGPTLRLMGHLVTLQHLAKVLEEDERSKLAEGEPRP